jgi:hypothetical protein
MPDTGRARGSGTLQHKYRTFREAGVLAVEHPMVDCITTLRSSPISGRQPLRCRSKIRGASNISAIIARLAAAEVASRRCLDLNVRNAIFQ